MGWAKPNARQANNLLFVAIQAASGRSKDVSAQRIELEQGTVICEPGDAARYVYFPLSCVLSAVAAHRDGTMLATTLRGHEGGFGLLTALRKAKTHARCQVQIGGPALRVEAQQLATLFDASAKVRHVLLCYWDAVMAQYEQTAICTTRHTVTSRMGRCLLDIHDRVVGDAFPLTHQHMANLIAANRTTVSLAAAALQRAGLIGADRCRISIIDRNGLRAASCECYARVRSTYEKVFDTSA